MSASNPLNNVVTTIFLTTLTYFLTTLTCFTASPVQTNPGVHILSPAYLVELQQIN